MNLKQIVRFFTDSRYRFVSLAEKGLLNWMPDEQYLTKKYKIVMGKKLDLTRPVTFNEKLQWLKIYNRKPIYTQMVDKYEAKHYISQRIGQQYVIPTYGVWEHFDDIDFASLPDRFVLKTTHDSGGVVLCENKDTFDYAKAKQKLEPRLKNNFFWHGREWPYKNVRPRIIAEEYLQLGQVEDYKMMCFNGEVKCAFICSGRGTKDGLRVTIFDMDWNVMPMKRHYPNVKEGFPKPEHFDEMVMLSEKLSEGIPFLRVDFYEVAGKLKIGELTFFPASGFEKFSPESWDETLGNWISLEHI